MPPPGSIGCSGLRGVPRPPCPRAGGGSAHVERLVATVDARAHGAVERHVESVLRVHCDIGPVGEGVPLRALVGPGRRGGQRVLNIHPATPGTPARIGELPVAAIGTVARPPGAADQHGIDGVGIALAIHRERGVLETHLRRHRQSVQRPARAAIGRDRVLPGRRHHVDLVVSAHAEVGAGVLRTAGGSRVPHPLEAPGAGRGGRGGGTAWCALRTRPRAPRPGWPRWPGTSWPRRRPAR